MGTTVPTVQDCCKDRSEKVKDEPTAYCYARKQGNAQNKNEVMSKQQESLSEGASTV